MKSIIFSIFLVYMLGSCSTSHDNRESTNNDLFGKWKTEKFEMAQFFGFFQMPLRNSLSDSTKWEKGYLCDEFYIYFINDSIYNYKSKIGKAITGKYERKNDSLKLRMKNEPFDWINFKIDSSSTNSLHLSRDNYAVVYYVNNDTITIRTGSKITITLRKENCH